MTSLNFWQGHVPITFLFVPQLQYIDMHEFLTQDNISDTLLWSICTGIKKTGLYIKNKHARIQSGG